MDEYNENRPKEETVTDEAGEEVVLNGVSEEAVIGEVEGADEPFDDRDEDEEADEKEKLRCAVCDKEINFFTKNKVTRGLYICGDCEEKSAVHRYKKEMRKLSPEEALRVVNNKITKAENFQITKSIDGYFLMDKPKELWTVPYAATAIKRIPRIDPAMIFSYDAIKSYELIENGNCMAKGGLGMPPIGGLLFGEDGAGFSANSEDKDICEQLQIMINLQNVSVPRVFINLIFKDIDKEKKAYGAAVLTAQKILSALENITRSKEGNHIVNSPADEIKKYKELLDMGAITPEEYEEKKKKLLSL